MSEAYYKVLRKDVYLIRKEILDLFFPPRCPVCDEVLPLLDVSQPQKACPECVKKLCYIAESCCKKCGKPVELHRMEYCSDCRRKHHEFDSGKALFQYKGAMKETMYRFKYSARREYADFFAEEAARLYGDWIRRKKIQLILPVPMYRKKRGRRGYNQAEDFARRLGEKMGIPVDSAMVNRVKDTIPQKGLSEKERHENMKNAFHIGENIVKYEHILVVDDIYTTGSTIDEVAREIKNAKTAEICFLCICVGKGL